MAWRFTRTALLLAFLFFGILSLRHYIFSADEAVRPGFSPSDTPEDLLPALQWYADSAVGALRPNVTRALVLATKIPTPAIPANTRRIEPKAPNYPSARIVYTKALHDRLQLFNGCINSSDDFLDCRSPTIRRGFQNQIWWPGVPFDEQTFLYSPQTFQITGIREIRKNTRMESPTLSVRFSWKSTGVSKIEQIVLEQGVVQTSPSPSEGEQEVEFLSSKYGYFLPLTREPVPAP